MDEELALYRGVIREIKELIGFGKDSKVIKVFNDGFVNVQDMKGAVEELTGMMSWVTAGQNSYIDNAKFYVYRSLCLLEHAIGGMPK